MLDIKKKIIKKIWQQPIAKILYTSVLENSREALVTWPP